MTEFDQAGLDVRKDMLSFNKDAVTFMVEKGVSVNTVEDTTPFKQKLSSVGFYKEWKEG